MQSTYNFQDPFFHLINTAVLLQRRETGKKLFDGMKQGLGERDIIRILHIELRKMKKATNKQLLALNERFA